MKTYSRFMAATLGFLLPWQTRWMIMVPTSGGAVWDFGVVSVYVAEAALFVWLMQEAWAGRKEIRAWCAHTIFHTLRGRVCAGAAAVFIVLQFLITQQRTLTALAVVGGACVAGLVVVLLHHEEIHLPFVGGFLIAVTLQTLMALTQTMFGTAFASTLLGMAAHHAGDHGAAVVMWGGRRYLRAYGGQPHPNIFGGLVLVALVLYGWVIGRTKFLVQKKNLTYSAVLFSAALFFSFSRSAWAAAALMLVFIYWRGVPLAAFQRMFLKWCVGTFIVLAVVFAPLVFSRVSVDGGVEQRSIHERISGLVEWKQIFSQHIFFGTGVWAYTGELANRAGYDQTPVHSAPLLFIAEAGIAGIIFCVLLFLLTPFFRRAWPFFFIAAPILIFDHYLYSLWSGLVISACGMWCAYISTEYF